MPKKVNIYFFRHFKKSSRNVKKELITISKNLSIELVKGDFINDLKILMLERTEGYIYF